MIIETITASPYLTGAVTAAVLLAGVWIVSLLISDASIIDMFWGGGYAAIATTTMLMADNLSPLGIATGLAVPDEVRSNIAAAAAIRTGYDAVIARTDPRPPGRQHRCQ